MTTVKIGGRVLKALARVSMVTALLAAVATGASAQDGVSKTTVTLGQSVAMTGPAAVLALPFAQGARLYFERVNAAGGIHGRKIELTTVDDAGNPETTLANTKKLLDQRVFSLFGYYGSPQVTVVNPLLKDSDLLLFAPMAAAVAIRDLRGKGYKGPIYGFSNTGESLLAEQLGAAGAGVVVVRVTPKSDNAKSTLVRELQADAAAAKLGKSNVYMLEGYIAAWTYTEALRKAGKEPTRAKLRKALDTLQEL